MNISQKIDRNRLKNLTAAVSGLVVSAGSFLVLIGVLPFTESPFGLSSYVYLTSGATLVVVFGGYLMFEYLTGAGPSSFGSVTITQSSMSSANREFATRVAEALAALHAEIKDVREGQVQAIAGDREQLIAAVRPTLVDDVARKVGEKLAESASEALRIQFIRDTFRENIGRLQLETAALNRRAAINLVIGALTTLIAAGVLFYLVVAQDKQFATVPELLQYYLPRLSLVVFIEVFAFFFLRLYRATLNELSSCQREITDLALHVSAIETAWASADVASKGLIAEAIVRARAPANASVGNGVGAGGADPKQIAELLAQFAKLVSAK